MGSSTTGTYRDSHTRPGKGGEYDSHFEFRHRGFLWSRERRILDQIIAKHFAGRPLDHLDFACGTGRILAHLEGRTRTSTGVDVSDVMLEEARKKLSRTELIKADIARENPFGQRRFDLITAFRFFPNAEDALRDEVAAAIVPLLRDDGCFVLNNHQNRYSAVGLTMRVYCWLRGSHFRTMTLGEIKAMASRAGLEVVETYYTGVVPGYEWLMIMPRSWYAVLESAFSRIGWLKHFALVQVVVCRRKS